MPFAMHFSLLPAHVDDLSIAHFTLFAATVDELVQRAEDGERKRR